MRALGVFIYNCDYLNNIDKALLFPYKDNT